MVEVLCVADRSKDEHQHSDHDHPTAECCVLQTWVRVDINTVIRTTEWWRCCVLQTGVRMNISTAITTTQQRSVVCCRQV